MKGILCVSLLILLIPSVACAAALPGDSANGNRLHDAVCRGRHETGIYTRNDRLVGFRCAAKTLATAAWQKKFPRLRAELIKYLNDQFYQFR